MGFSQFVFLCSLPLLLLSACQVESPTPTEQAIPRNTLVLRTATSQSLATDLPTATPYPPLSPNGPYILYPASESLNTKFFALDMEVFERREIVLPNEAQVTFDHLAKTVSPDGKRLVYLTPSSVSPQHYDLNLFDLQTGETLFISPHFSEDFPENQKLVADALSELGMPEDSLHFVEIGQGIGDIYLGTIAWSPNGRYLAFAAQIDGPSTDIYIYDLATGHIMPLTDEIFNIEGLAWSPDSQWLVFEHVFPETNNGVSTLEAVHLFTKEKREFIGLRLNLFTQGGRWISDTEYLTTSTVEWNEINNLRVTNLETGKITALWEGRPYSFAVDRENRVLAIFGLPDANSIDPEHFLVSYDGDRILVQQECSTTLQHFLGGEEARFVGRVDVGVCGIALDGSSHFITTANQSLCVSPDLRWLLVGTNRGFELYDNANQLIHTFLGITLPEDYLGQLKWRPDGEGFIFRSDERLYYLALPDGEPVFIEDCPSSDCWMRYLNNYVWLP